MLKHKTLSCIPFFLLAFLSSICLGDQTIMLTVRGGERIMFTGGSNRVHAHMKRVSFLQALTGKAWEEPVTCSRATIFYNLPIDWSPAVAWNLNSKKRKKRELSGRSREKGWCSGLKLGQGHIAQPEQEALLLIPHMLALSKVLCCFIHNEMYSPKGMP